SGIAPKRQISPSWRARGFMFEHDGNGHGSAETSQTAPTVPNRRWTFLSSHAHVCLCLVREPSLRMREVAETLGITERAVQRIVKDLVDEGYLTRSRVGRRNQYEFRTDRPMRHPFVAHRAVKSLMDLIGAN